nr:MAG TPA: hypothetical protein [Caudoviricetes sp.]
MYRPLGVLHALLRAVQPFRKAGWVYRVGLAV